MAPRDELHQTDGDHGESPTRRAFSGAPPALIEEMSGNRSEMVFRSCFLLMVLLPGMPARAADWPMWRCDAGHTGATSASLPRALSLAWSRQYPRRVPVWEDALNQDMMPYDAVLEPVVAGGRMFLGMNDSDKVVALDARTGEELWRFYADGPVRLPPAVVGENVFFTSDDGHLYGVAAADGQLRWRFRGGPSARKALGNGRLISAWPARGGPVVRDGTIYFGASIWPLMGTFIHALDATTGNSLWLNDSTGADFIKQPHGAPAFAGVAPQGVLTIAGDALLVPGGRSCPAVFDRRSGAPRYFFFGAKGQGGSFVAADARRFFVHTRGRGTTAFALADGKELKFSINEPVLDGATAYAANTPGAASDGRAAPPVVQAFGPDNRVLWQVEADGTGDLIKAGDRLYAAGKQAITAIDLPREGRPARVAWSLPVDGRVRRLLAGCDMLFAVTDDGCILAFGAEQVEPRHWPFEPHEIAVSPEHAARAESLLGALGAGEGYCLWFGADDLPLLEAVVMGSQLQLIVVDGDAARVERLRRRFDGAGLYGRRLMVVRGEPLSFGAPPYIAVAIVVAASALATWSDDQALATAYQSLRPYGGTMWIAAPTPEAEALRRRVAGLDLEGASVRLGNGGVLVTRAGPLDGAAPWTHAYGDVANTVKSNDRRVRLPLGVLWFGGNSNADVLPRHGHGPCPQVIGGRLFIEGINCLSARDVYTGRVLWRRQFDDLGTMNVYYDASYADTPLSTAYNQAHIPGANARGTNFVATAEGVYLAVGDRCLLLDAATGETLRQFELPAEADRRRQWGFIGVYEGVLLAGNGFAEFSSRLGYREPTEPEAPAAEKSRSGSKEKKESTSAKRSPAWLPDRSASLGLVAFDRRDGRILWRFDADQSLLHNAIVAGGGRVYCLDKLPRRVEDHLRRRGLAPDGARLVALDARDGRILWQRTDRTFGTWLAYSATHDVLIQAGAAANDRSPDETSKGIAALRASDGRLIWEKPTFSYSGPCILHGETILTNTSSYQVSQGALRLADGAPATIPHPITGQPIAWRFTRTYGCNTAIAAEHLLTFRSGAAGFFDLATYGGTGNFGGFKSGCTSNLIVADGVLSAPDYTRTCSCGYQNQTSLALVPMDDVELWTYNCFDFGAKAPGDVRRLGINFGAPGNRRADDGTLWIEHPRRGGASPETPIEISGNPRWFRHHAARYAGEGPTWVAASGVEAAREVTVWLDPAAAAAALGANGDSATAAAPPERRAAKPAGSSADRPSAPAPRRAAAFTVRLHFAEPDDSVAAGQRVFRVRVQDRTAAERFDPVAAASGPRRGYVLAVASVVVSDRLVVRLEPLSSGEPILCGIELVAESPR